MFDRSGRHAIRVVLSTFVWAATALEALAQPSVGGGREAGPAFPLVAAMGVGLGLAAPTSAAAMAAFARPTGDAQWRCLAEALYFEARGEAVLGQVAVAEVILNRVDSPAYPDTVCEVVRQGDDRQGACQFSYRCDGRTEAIGDRAAWAEVGRVARAMLDGAPRRLTDGATHYHAGAVSPSWAAVFPRTASIGHHRFYRETLILASN